MIADRRGVRVIYGANDGVFEVAGETVGRVRASLVHAFNVPDDAVALSDGRRVQDGFRLADNSVLEFIREAGVKGGKKKNLTEEDLNGLGFAIVGDEAVRIEDAYPDESWEPSRLEAYAKGRLARSSRAERESILQAEKAAIDLYWAGCALKFIREKKKAERHGAWTEWKREQGYHDTTVNDAIRLYEKAKTPDALYGMGITAAKEKFVYPFRDTGDDDGEVMPSKSRRKERTATTRAAGAGSSSRNPTTDPADTKDHEEDDEGNTETEGKPPVSDSTLSLTTELEEIAQRLNEIAQDEMGKVDWSEQDPARFQKAAIAVSDAINNIFTRINNDQQIA